MSSMGLFQSEFWAMSLLSSSSSSSSSFFIQSQPANTMGLPVIFICLDQSQLKIFQTKTRFTIYHKEKRIMCYPWMMMWVVLENVIRFAIRKIGHIRANCVSKTWFEWFHENNNKNFHHLHSITWSWLWWFLRMYIFCSESIWLQNSAQIRRNFPK